MIRSAAEHPFSEFWKRNLDKIGIGGSVFAALCCLGFPALLSILSAIGLGFIVNDAILIPLLLLFLAVTLLGLYLGTRHHHEPWALILGGLSALAIAVVFLGLAPSRIVAYAGMTGLVVASILNVWLETRGVDELVHPFGPAVNSSNSGSGLGKPRRSHSAITSRRRATAGSLPRPAWRVASRHQGWRRRLLDLKRRGLAIGPELAVADGALGFWQAIEEVWPRTRGQGVVTLLKV